MSKTDHIVLAKLWLDAKQAKEDAEKILSKAKESLAVAQKNFATSILPPDAKPKEKFNVWIDSTLLICVEVSEIPPTPMGEEIGRGREPHYVYIRTQTK